MIIPSLAHLYERGHTLKFNVIFYEMGNAVSDELSCMGSGLADRVTAPDLSSDANLVATTSASIFIWLSWNFQDVIATIWAWLFKTNEIVS